MLLNSEHDLLQGHDELEQAIKGTVRDLLRNKEYGHRCNNQMRFDGAGAAPCFKDHLQAMFSVSSEINQVLDQKQDMMASILQALPAASLIRGRDSSTTNASSSGRRSQHDQNQKRRPNSTDPSKDHQKLYLAIDDAEVPGAQIHRVKFDGKGPCRVWLRGLTLRHTPWAPDKQHLHLVKTLDVLRRSLSRARFDAVTERELLNSKKQMVGYFLTDYVCCAPESKPGESAPAHVVAILQRPGPPKDSNQVPAEDGAQAEDAALEGTKGAEGRWEVRVRGTDEAVTEAWCKEEGLWLDTAERIENFESQEKWLCRVWLTYPWLFPDELGTPPTEAELEDITGFEEPAKWIREWRPCLLAAMYAEQSDALLDALSLARAPSAAAEGC
eukprot:TRINITY_DN3550_c0_g1_i1.p1 TRINITY_DN3550_c0_g1~~TRINITY_DN3550_c0_g1_i1.p1  ORF type:complete len:385 (+),score=51.07 TRINITY_DN3550_c0_g1_i1:111-1265(+)